MPFQYFESGYHSLLLRNNLVRLSKFITKKTQIKHNEHNTIHGKGNDKGNRQ